MAEKSTFARRVRAAKPRATKREIRDDAVSGLTLTIQPTGVQTYFLARIVRGRRQYATIGSADAMNIPEAQREARRLIVRSRGGPVRIRQSAASRNRRKRPNPGLTQNMDACPAAWARPAPAWRRSAPSCLDSFVIPPVLPAPPFRRSLRQKRH